MIAVVCAWWNRYFLGAEFTVAAVVTAGLAYLVHHSRFACHVDSVIEVSHPFIYGALASVCGSLLGFNLAATSIVLATVYSNSPGLSIVRKSKQYRTIWKVFFATTKALATATVLALAGLVVDRTGALSIPLLWSTVFAFLLSCLRVFRAGWVLKNIIDLTVHPSGRARRAGSD